MTEEEFFKSYTDRYGPQGEAYALQDIAVSDNDPNRVERLLFHLAEMRDVLREKQHVVAARYVAEAMADLMSFQGMLYRIREWAKPPEA